MADILHLNVDTDYPMPWIVWKKEWSFTGDGKDDTFTTNHGLGFAPLLIGTWSLNSDFDPAYDLLTTDPYMSAEFSANSTQVRAFTESISGNVYCRLMGLLPPDVDIDATPVNYDETLAYNSHYRYPKLYRAGYVEAGGMVDYPIWGDDGLVIVPQVRTWIVKSGYVYPSTCTASEGLVYNTHGYPWYYHIYGASIK